MSIGDVSFWTFLSTRDTSIGVYGEGKIKMKISKLAVAILMIVIIIIGNMSYGANTSKNTTNTSNSTKNATSKSEKNADDEDVVDGLESIKIEGAEISPEFSTEKYEYTVKYIGEDTKLQIETTTTEAYYETEIIGNKNLKEGENLITILVSEPNGNNVATYQLTVNKSLVDEKATVKEGQDKKQEQQKIIAIIISCIAGTIALLIIIIAIVRKIRN